PDPFHVIDLPKHHEDHRRHLCKRVCLSKNAGSEIAQSGDRVENSANQQDADVAAEHEHRELPRNERQSMHAHNREHKEGRAEQQLVCDRVEILPEQSLLTQSAREQSIKAIAKTSEDKKNQSCAVMSVYDLDDHERQERESRQGELVRRGENLRQFERPCLRWICRKRGPHKLIFTGQYEGWQDRWPA